MRREQFPWSLEVTKCASGQAVMDLGRAFSNFFRDLKKPKWQRRARFPRFKKKGVRDGFALWNDQFQIDENRIRIPRVGWVKMREALRFDGKIMGARVGMIGGRWHVSVQVEMQPDTESASHEIVGVDLGISSLMVLSQPLPDGREKIANPAPRRRLLKRVKKLQRRISRQELRRRKLSAKTSRRQCVRRDRLRRLHHRIACIRSDAAHKATTEIARTFRVVVLEDLNVSGMAKNHRLAGSILDAAPYELRRQIEYKVAMRGGRVVIADRWFPSSKTCSECGVVADKMPLHVRDWTCGCGAVHDRDINAARNLELVGRATSEPVAGDPPSTRGEMEALATGEPVVKPPSVNRELQPARASEM